MQISLSSPELLTFFQNSRWRPPPTWIFRLCAFGHSGFLTVWYLCSVPNLVQISVIVTEIDAHNASDLHLMTSCELSSEFDFWSRGHLRMAVSHNIWCRYFYPIRRYWHFFEIQDGGRNYSATSNNTKSVHWPLMDGLLHLVQPGGAWAGWGPAESPPRCTHQRPVYQSLYCYMMAHCSVVLMWRLRG